MNHINWVAYGVSFKVLYIHTKTNEQNKYFCVFVGFSSKNLSILFLKFQEFVNSVSER